MTVVRTRVSVSEADYKHLQAQSEEFKKDLDEERLKVEKLKGSTQGLEQVGGASAHGDGTVALG